MSDELLYQIALTQVPNIGAVQARLLVDALGQASAIFTAKKSDLEKIEGIGTARAHSIKRFEQFKVAEEEMKFIEKYHIQTLFLKDEHYPKRLLQCYDPPTLLYYRGNASLNHPKIVSIIGTRTHTEYGRQVTDQIVSQLHNQQVLIVSGLAYGIDGVAHKSAVQHNLPTIGVLAHGLDKIYPSQHKALAKQMLGNGGLLTEFGKDTLPDKHNFPRRNRIVAGMADATIVIETAIKGGSMITAELAIGYNRDLFAVPGRITDTKSAGCNYLIQQLKAQVFSSVDQMLEVLGWSETKKAAKPQKELFINFSPEEQIVVDIIKQKASVNIDEIFLKSGLNSSTVAATLLSLEFENVILSLPGKMYQLT